MEEILEEAEERSHQKSIVSLAFIDDVGALFSTSVDGSFQIRDAKLNLRCYYHLYNAGILERKWDFPFDWSTMKA